MGTKQNVDDQVAKYRARRPLYEQFAKRLKSLISELLDGSDIPYVIESRAKEVRSFRNKITRPDKDYSDPLLDVRDLAGLRIIVPDVNQIDPVCALIEAEFELDTPNCIDKRKSLGLNEFGYRSTHFVVRFNQSRSELSEYSRYKELYAEIQIRTVLEDAWASLDHKLRYKPGVSLPDGMLRKLFQLSATLELVDEGFGELLTTAKEYSEKATKSFASAHFEFEIDAITVEAYVQSSTDVAQILRKAAEAGFIPEPPNSTSDKYFASYIAGISAAREMKSIAQLNAYIVKAIPWCGLWFSAMKDHIYTGLARPSISVYSSIVLLLLAEDISAEDLDELGFGEPITNNLASARAALNKKRKL